MPQIIITPISLAAWWCATLCHMPILFNYCYVYVGIWDLKTVCRSLLPHTTPYWLMTILYWHMPLLTTMSTLFYLHMQNKEMSTYDLFGLEAPGSTNEVWESLGRNSNMTQRSGSTRVCQLSSSQIFQKALKSPCSCRDHFINNSSTLRLHYFKR